MTKKMRDLDPEAAALAAARRALAAEDAKSKGEVEDENEEREDDEDEEEEDEDALGAHELLRADAEAKHMAAAEAYKASAGTDSAAALMAAEDAGEAAYAAHQAARASSMKLRGAVEEDPKSAPREPAPPPAPAPGAARALASLAGPSAAAQLELAQLAELGRGILARTAKASAAEALLVVEGWATAAAEVGKVRAEQKRLDVAKKKNEAAALAKAFHDRLTAAVQAGMDRARAFDVKVVGDREVLTPKAAWTGGTLAQLDGILTEMGYPADAPPARAALIIASPDGGGEAGLAARAAAMGVDIETRRLAEMNRSKDR